MITRQNLDFCLKKALLIKKDRMRPTITPKPAATLLIWSEQTSPQVFMLKRQSQSGFFANAHVFPGGVVEDTDLEWCHNQDNTFLRAMSDMLGNRHGFHEALAFFLAAIRETAEESGLLYAVDSSGNFPNQSVVNSVLDSIEAGDSFYQTLLGHQLTPDVQAIVPISWWITPEVEKRRYNTRFFLAPSPPGQSPRVNKSESSLGLYISPAQALEGYFAGDLLLAPPTLAMLELLAQMTSFEQLPAMFPMPNQPICPEASVNENGQLLLTLPGDPQHSQKSEPVLLKRTRFEANAHGRFI